MLYFRRSRTDLDYSQEYSAETDVDLFADLEGWEYFTDCIRLAIGEAAPIQVDTSDAGTSMRCVILRPDFDIQEAKLRIWERSVFDRSRAEMELVIFGSKSGLAWLLEKSQELMARAKDPSDHTHLFRSIPSMDGDAEWPLVNTDVELTLRGPVPLKRMKIWFTAARSDDSTPGFLAEKTPEPYALPQGVWNRFERL